MFDHGFIRKLFLALALPLAAHAQENITIEQYAAIPDPQRSQVATKIANSYAKFYDLETAKKNEKEFHDIISGGTHSLGVATLNTLINRIAEKQNIHSVSLNTVIGKYLVAEYGMPPSLQK